MRFLFFQTLLGSLILHHGQVTGIVGTKPIATGGTADKSPSLLTMASTDGSQWFSLLPVTAPVNLHKKVEKVVSAIFSIRYSGYKARLSDGHHSIVCRFKK